MSFGGPVCLLGPRVWLEQTLGSDGLVSVLGSTSDVIMSESLNRAKLLHIENVVDHCVSHRAVVKIK